MGDVHESIPAVVVVGAVNDATTAAVLVGCIGGDDLPTACNLRE